MQFSPPMPRHTSHYRKVEATAVQETGTESEKDREVTWTLLAIRKVAEKRGVD